MSLSLVPKPSTLNPKPIVEPKPASVCSDLTVDGHALRLGSKMCSADDEED